MGWERIIIFRPRFQQAGNATGAAGAASTWVGTNRDGTINWVDTSIGLTQAAAGTVGSLVAPAAGALNSAVRQRHQRQVLLFA
jgi:hypothetical protein